MRNIIPFLFFFLTTCVTAQIDLKKKYTFEELNEILENARLNKDQKTLSTVYFLLAEYEANVFANYDKSLEYYSRAKQYFQILGDSFNVSKTQHFIGKKYMKTGFYEESASILNGLLNSPYAEKYPNNKAWILFELAEISKLKGDQYSALELMEKSKSVNQFYKDTLLEAKYHLGKIDSYILLNEKDSALISALKAFKVSNEIKNMDLLSESLFYIGFINKLKGQYNNAIKYLLKAETFLPAKDYDNNRKKIYEELANVFEASNNYKLALVYKNKYTTLNDSILNQARIESISNLALKYGTREKESNIKLLEIDKQYAELRNKQQRRALYFLAGSLFLALGFLYFLKRFYDQRITSSNIINQQREEINQRKIKELEDDIKITSMHSVIEGQEIERERIAKELHDSLGGLLSTIKLQIDKTKMSNKDNNVESYGRAHHLIDAAVEEVRTISRNLQPVSLKKLGLVAAIKDLINRFEGENTPEIYFQYYDVPAQMDKMLSLTVYRIIQELLTNSFKHAKAKEILIQLNSEEDAFVIQYEDDGVGFELDEPTKKGMGLENIKSRVNYLHGSLSIDTHPGSGLSVLIRLKYDKSIS
ncbi:MAG: sensor histidine kinase [Saprospiraceae bacterium]|nr:sensor histidine kinase [Saprospiraceae bacterium]MBK6564555.1 sensor histidine kinase [Saprospiraceae bacterium]MBK8079290.1 sensor histidine kinase [Saprospiraceae bacterium]MBK8819566.1 sensor histidine kinase [Saprospiraceae bacterium]MBP6695014.1 sensor histidine kinase [Saprospiraceae bacterium]